MNDPGDAKFLQTVWKHRFSAAMEVPREFQGWRFWFVRDLSMP